MEYSVIQVYVNSSTLDFILVLYMYRTSSEYCVRISTETLNDDWENVLGDSDVTIEGNGEHMPPPPPPATVCAPRVPPFRILKK